MPEKIKKDKQILSHPEQGYPTLTVLPFGGLGEIGMNAMLIAYGKDAILVDCGVLFPDADLPGVDYVVPDFFHLKSLGYDLKAYVLTHGHEDHIGALPYALPIAPAPIYASLFTCGLIQNKLSERNIEFNLHEVSTTQNLEIGPFVIDFIRVTHSIPDSFGMAIHTPLGTIVHTGDFKIDHRPVDGEKTDLSLFASYGERGVLLLMSDSTNSEISGTSLSEADIQSHLENAMRTADGRIYIAVFASHIHRIQQIVDRSRPLGRKIVLNGRSMQQNVALARSLGILQAKDEDFVSIEHAKTLPPAHLTVLTTGSQAEPGSAIARLATRDQPNLPIQEGDLVLFSSRSIPGNERSISRAINGLTAQGARVLYGPVSRLHTSGHAHQEEQRLMLNLVKPRYFLPVHGEYRHLAAHAHTAKESGVKKENIFILENGQSLVFKRSEAGEVQAERGPSHPIRKILVDGKGVGDISEMVIRDRQQLANAGMLICVLTLDSLSGSVLTGPDFLSRGIVLVDENRELFDEAKEVVVQTLAEHTKEALLQRAGVEDIVRTTLRRFFRKKLDRRPVVLPFVLYS